MATGMISDVASSCRPEHYQSHLQKIVEMLMSVLTESRYESQTKLVAIVAIGDLCLATEDQALQYLPVILMHLGQASNTSLTEGADEDEE
jgi:hypothetical protein